MSSTSNFGRWCQTTCYHGVYEFYMAKNAFLKLVWLIAVVVGCFLAVNQSVEFILDFAWEDEWQASVSSETPTNGLMTWPNVTICGPSRFSASKLRRYGLTDPYEVAYLAAGTTGVSFYDRLLADAPFYKTSDFELTTRNISRSVVEKRRTITESLSPGCDDIVVHCGRNVGADFRLYCNCKEISVESDRPGCFMIMPMKIGHQFREFRRPGYESGVQFLFNPRIADYYPNVLFHERPTSGLNLLIYFGDTDDDPSIPSTFVAPGTHTVVAMTAERHRTKARSARFLNFYTKQLPCAADVEYKWLSAILAAPSRELCQMDCLVQLSMDSCHCNVKVFPMRLKPSVKTCRGDRLRACLTKMLNSTVGKSGASFNMTRCAEKCKAPCHFESITTKVSTSQFPASSKLASFIKYVNRAYAGNVSEDDVRQFMLLEMFYETNEYKVIEKVDRVSMDQLISNIGGTLGVWTGLSVIGMFQAFVYVLYGLQSTAQKTRDGFIGLSKLWCQATAYHGVADFYFAKSTVGKAVWFSVVIIGLFFTLNQTTELLLDFVLQDKWLTSMYLEIPPDGYMKWPHVRICNRNILSASKLKKAGYADPYDIAYLNGEKKGLVFHANSRSNFSQFKNTTDVEDTAGEIKSRMKIRTEHSRMRVMQSVSFGCEDVLIYCDGDPGFTPGRPFCNCTDSEMQMTDDAGCLHVNATYIASQSMIRGRTGYESAVRFLIDPNIGDYYPELLHDELADGGVGVRLYFGSFNNDVLRFSPPIFLSPGSHTVVAMSLQKHRTKVRRRRGVNLYHTKLPCMADASYRWIQSGVPLRTMCTIDCTIHLYMLHCECIPQQLAPLLDTIAPTCDEDDLAACLNRTEADWHSGPWPDNFNYSRCINECKDPCEFDAISTKVSASQFPAPSKLKAFATYINLESSRNGKKVYSEEKVRQFILMDLYHEANEYQVIERVNRVSLDEVVSNIGGALGAWTGISFITIFQAFVYMGYSFTVLLSRLRKRTAMQAVAPAPSPST